MRRFLDGGHFPDDLEVDVGIDWGWRAVHRLATVEPNPETGQRDGVAHLGDVLGVYQISTGEFFEPYSSFGARWLIVHWRLGADTAPANPVDAVEIPLTSSDRFGWQTRLVCNAARWRYLAARRLGRPAA